MKKNIVLRSLSVMTAALCLPVTGFNVSAAKLSAKYVGDVNHSGAVSSEDATAILIDYAGVLSGDAATISVREGDINHDSKVSSEDATYILVEYAKELNGDKVEWEELPEVLNAVDWTKIGNEMQAQADAYVSSRSDLDAFQFAVMDSGIMKVSGISGSPKGQSFSANTSIGVASSSKMMAVTAVLKLVDEGRVSLDAPVTDYLPDFHMQDERYKKITVRMLMNHSSGLLGNTNGCGSWRLGALGNKEFHDSFMEHLSSQRLKSDPGKYSTYCNDGFTLLTYICESVSGLSFEEYLRKNILSPLGMTHTYSPMESFNTSLTALSDFGGLGLLPPVTAEAAQGGMFSTAEDLCRLGRIYANGGSGILKSDTVSATFEQEYRRGIWCADGNSTMNFGLGWDAVELYPFSELGIKAVTKNGDILLSGSQFIVLPEYHLVAAATGVGQGNSVSKNYLIYYLLRILQEKGVIDTIPSQPSLSNTGGQIPSATLSYAGTYIKASMAFDISFSGNTMIKTNLPSGYQTTYTHIGNGHFTSNNTHDYWFMEEGGEKYLVNRTWDGNPLISLPNVAFQGAKTSKPSLDSSTKSAWRNRNGKTYLLVSEPYDSFAYIYPDYGLSIPTYKMTISVNPDISPYWRGMLLTDADNAKNAAEVPVFASTNVVDASFSRGDGTEYMTLSSGLTYRLSDGISSIGSGTSVSVNGTAKWFRSSVTGTLSYDIPEGCSVIVYDSSLNLKDHSFIKNSSTVSVSSGDYIVFVGNGTIAAK